MSTGTLQLWKIWLCLENGREYQIINLEDQEVVASTAINLTPPLENLNSFIWQSDVAGFLGAFKFVKMGPKPQTA